MIRFACPACKNILQALEEHIGTKLSCPKCGRRLQVPPPPRDKTLLGSALPEVEKPARNQPVRGFTLFVSDADLEANEPRASGVQANGFGQAVSVPEKARPCSVEAKPAPAARPANRRSPAGVSRAGKVGGPISFQQLQQLAATNRLRPTDHVLQPGSTTWKAAGDLPGLFGKNPLAAAAPPTPAPRAIPQPQPAQPPVAIFVGSPSPAPTPQPIRGPLPHRLLLAAVLGGGLFFCLVGAVLAFYCFADGFAPAKTSPAPADPDEDPAPGLSPRQKKINAAIERGVKYLRQRLHKEGSFYAMGDPAGGIMQRWHFWG